MLIKFADGAAMYTSSQLVCFVTLSNLNSWIGRGVEYKCSKSEQAFEEKVDLYVESPTCSYHVASYMKLVWGKTCSRVVWVVGMVLYPHCILVRTLQQRYQEKLVYQGRRLFVLLLLCSCCCAPVHTSGR